jgi:hypothetical protein
MSTTPLMPSEIKCGAARASQTAAALGDCENLIKIEWWLGFNLGDFGGVQPGSLDEAMHIELGTLRASHPASES